MWRDYAVTLSFPGGAGRLFYRKSLPGFGVYFGLVADVLLLSLALYAVVRASPKMPQWARRLLPIGAIALVLRGTAFLERRLRTTFRCA